MPTRTEHVPANVFLEHLGFKIYHTYKNNEIDVHPASSYRFCTHDDGDYEAGHGEDGVFDVRELKAWLATNGFTQQEQNENAIKRAIETGEIRQFITTSRVGVTLGVNGNDEGLEVGTLDEAAERVAAWIREIPYTETGVDFRVSIELLPLDDRADGDE